MATSWTISQPQSCPGALSLSPDLHASVSWEWPEALKLDLTQRLPGKMDSVSSRLGAQLTAFLAWPCTPTSSFGVSSSSRRGERREGERKGTRGPLRQIICALQRGRELCPAKTQTPQPSEPRPVTIGKEAGDGQGEEAQAGRPGQLRVGVCSGQAGNVSLWRGPSWLGAALAGFSFKHHD